MNRGFHYFLSCRLCCLEARKGVLKVSSLRSSPRLPPHTTPPPTCSCVRPTLFCVHVQPPSFPCSPLFRVYGHGRGVSVCVLWSSWRSRRPGVLALRSDSTVSLSRVDGSVSKGTSVSESRQLASGFNKAPPTTKSISDGCIWRIFGPF